MTVIHPTWEIPVRGSALVLMPCPGTKEATLDATLSQLSTSGVRVIVSAITTKELEATSLTHFDKSISKYGMKWFHLPIEDDSVPDDVFDAQWDDVASILLAELNQGKIALHCMGGSGRTGLLAARFLLELHWSITDIFTQVRELRPNAFSRREQKNYVETILRKKNNLM